MIEQSRDGWDEALDETPNAARPRESLPPPETPWLGASDLLTSSGMDILARLPPAGRLRFLAFLHLFDHPEAIQVDFAAEPSGLRLVLTQRPDRVPSPHKAPNPSGC